MWCALRLVQVLTTQALDCAAGVVEGCGMDASDSSLTAAAAEIEAAAAAMDDELRTSQQPSAAVDASQDVDMSATSAGESTGVDTVTQVRTTGEDASGSNGLCVACLSSHAAWCAACVVRGSASVRVGTGRHSWRHHKGAREAATRAGCGRRGVTLCAVRAQTLTQVVATFGQLNRNLEHAVEVVRRSTRVPSPARLTRLLDHARESWLHRVEVWPT